MDGGKNLHVQGNRKSIDILWRNDNGGQESTQYLNARLSSGQCVDTSIGTWNLNIYQSGYYTIRATVDSNNRLNEDVRYNNALSKYLYLQY